MASKAKGGLVGIVVDTGDIRRIADLMRAAAETAPQAVARALNRTATETRTAMRRVLSAQMGVPQNKISRGLTVTRATRGSLTVAIVARGSFQPLRDFKARPTRKGVSAAPWNKRRIFPHTFINGMGGHVFVRVGIKRLPIRKLYGPALPNEFVKDQSAATFHATVPDVLLKRLDHELGRLLK